jgi:hypothetical protein
MSVPNTGYTYSTTIPIDGVIEIDTSIFAPLAADIFHISVSGGGLLKGLRLLQIAPPDNEWYTTFTVSAAAGEPPFAVAHMDGTIAAGEQIYCPQFLNTTITEEHDHFFRYSYESGAGAFVSKANTWISAIAVPASNYSGTTSGSGTYSVTFSPAFAATPNVQASIIGGTGNQFVLVTSRSNTEFTVTVYTRDVVTADGQDVLAETATPTNGLAVDVFVSTND